MAIAQILKATDELKDGAQRRGLVSNFTLNFHPLRFHESQRDCGKDGEHGGRNEGRDRRDNGQLG